MKYNLIFIKMGPKESKSKSASEYNPANPTPA